MKQVPGSGRESVGGSKKLGEWCCMGDALLRLYASWQVQFQECVNYSNGVWSLVYIPYSQ